MKRWLIMVVLAGAACATTTAAGAAPNGAAQRPVAADAQPDPSVAPTEEPSDQPGVVVVATSPTDVQFRASSSDTVVPLGPVRRHTPTRRRVWVMSGMVVGAVLGAVVGLIQGTEKDRRETAAGAPECDPLCGGNAIIDPLGLGAVGLGVGAALGAGIGAFDRE